MHVSCIILLGLLALTHSTCAAAIGRKVLQSEYCCTLSHPCWGFGTAEGQCCSDANNGGCRPAKPCRPGRTPQDTAPLCADAAVGTPQEGLIHPGTAATARALGAIDPLAAAEAAQAAGLDPAAAYLAAQAANAAAASQPSGKKPKRPKNPANPVNPLDAAQAALAAGQDPAAAWQAAVAAGGLAAPLNNGGGGNAGAGQQVAAQGGGGGGGSWSNIAINRFGDYSSFGQGQGFMGTVSCTGKIPPPPGLWTAMNYRAFGLPSLPCGMRLQVTAPSGASVVVTVVDGGGSDGLDMDSNAYRAVVPPGTDGIVGGFTVTAI